jgi:hypothetical protein
MLFSSLPLACDQGSIYGEIFLRHEEPSADYRSIIPWVAKSVLN